MKSYFCFLLAIVAIGCKKKEEPTTMEAAAAAACIISLSGIGERDVALSQIEYRLGIIPCPIFILFLLLRCGLSLPTSPDELFRSYSVSVLPKGTRQEIYQTKRATLENTGDIIHSLALVISTVGALFAFVL